MATNNSPAKHFKKLRKSDAQLWAYYDAQTPATRAQFQQFPLNLWPGSYNDHGHSFDDAHKRYLAGLRDVWGPDHPAVIDAARKVATRRGKIVQLATADDLDL